MYMSAYDCGRVIPRLPNDVIRYLGTHMQPFECARLCVVCKQWEREFVANAMLCLGTANYHRYVRERVHCNTYDACVGGSLDIVQLHFRVYPDASVSYRVVEAAAKHGHEDITDWLLEHAAIHTAAYFGACVGGHPHMYKKYSMMFHKLTHHALIRIVSAVSEYAALPAIKYTVDQVHQQIVRERVQFGMWLSRDSDVVVDDNCSNDEYTRRAILGEVLAGFRQRYAPSHLACADSANRCDEYTKILNYIFTDYRANVNDIFHALVHKIPPKFIDIMLKHCITDINGCLSQLCASHTADTLLFVFSQYGATSCSSCGWTASSGRSHSV